MYVWVAARFYFLLSFVDAYSRYIVHHKLLLALDGTSVAIELQAALEATQGATVHDHGSEFVNRDVAALIKVHNLIDTKTKPRHPESNAIAERFNGNTLDSHFCVEALEEALGRYGCPEIFNTDQGSQFTSEAFTGVPKNAGVSISLDGKGRWVDNVFVERLLA